MKKIYAILERLICIFAILLLSTIAIILFVKFNSKIILVVIAYICIVLIVLALLKLFSFSSHIIISSKNMVKVFDFPLFATNRFYDKKRSLILYNNEINIKQVEKIELIKLTKEEQKVYMGYKHLFNIFLKFNLKCGTPKYVYVGNYANYQIKKIISLLNNK